MVPCLLDSKHLSHPGQSMISQGILGTNSQHEPGYQCVSPKNTLTLA